MERLKKSFSKEFWAVIKTAIKYGKKATIAVKFRQETDESTGLVKPQVTFKEYIEKLFKKTDSW